MLLMSGGVFKNLIVGESKEERTNRIKELLSIYNRGTRDEKQAINISMFISMAYPILFLVINAIYIESFLFTIVCALVSFDILRDYAYTLEAFATNDIKLVKFSTRLDSTLWVMILAFTVLAQFNRW